MKVLNINRKIEIFRIILILLMLLLSFRTMAVDWPGSGGCTGTLQACIDAQPSSGSVTVKLNTVITETTLTINKGLFLTAGTGFKPIFRNMDMEINVPNDQKVTVQKFQFEQSSDLFVRLDENAEINILSNTWSNPDSTSGEKEGITVWSDASFQADGALVNIKQNTIISEGYNGPGIPLIQISHYTTGLMKINIHDNHLIKLDSSPTTFSTLLDIENISSGTIEAQVVANEMRGAITQIYLRQANDASASMKLGLVSNLISGAIDGNTVIDANPDNATLKSEIETGNFVGIIGNNTIDGVKRNTANVSTGFNLNDHITNGSSTINIFNNIIVNTKVAYDGPATGTSTSIPSGGNNVIFNHGTISGLTLLSSDRNQPPSFVKEGTNYALANNSPAINIVSPTGASLLYGTGFMQGSPSIDADGLRRYKGSKIDAGAYEWGDRHIYHKAVSPSFNSTGIADDDLDSNPNAVTIITQVWNYSGEAGVYNDQSIGIYRTGAKWRIFNQNTSADMPVNAKFHVYYPYGSTSDSLNGLSVYSSSGGTPGFELDDPFLNNNFAAGVFATNYWDAGSGGVYNDHPLEIGYQTSNKKWYLANADDANMSANAKFNIYNQDRSRNVFHHEVSAENTTLNTTIIDHPLLNNTPCALPMVTQSTTWFLAPLLAQNPNNIGVFYDGAHWRIFNQNLDVISIDVGGGPIPGGRFNVMVDPQQVYQCENLIVSDGLIFKNGFE